MIRYSMNGSATPTRSQGLTNKHMKRKRHSMTWFVKIHVGKCMPGLRIYKKKKTPEI